MGLRTRPGAIALFAATLLCSACSTLDYRAVQGDFEHAVRVDNEGTVNPFVDSSPALYAAVVARLAPDAIERLDPRLRANAWLLRAYAAWRAGDLETASDSVVQGRAAAPPPGSRDDVLLALLPALIVDSEVMDAWEAAGRPATPAWYRQHEKDFETAWEQTEQARARRGRATPPGVDDYLSYRRWRLLRNRLEVISRIDDPDQLTAALDRGRTQVGRPLQEAAAGARDEIPAAHALHRLIVGQSERAPR